MPCCNMGTGNPASNYQEVCVLVSVPVSIFAFDSLLTPHNFAAHVAHHQLIFEWLPPIFLRKPVEVQRLVPSVLL